MHVTLCQLPLARSLLPAFCSLAPSCLPAFRSLAHSLPVTHSLSAFRSLTRYPPKARSLAHCPLAACFSLGRSLFASRFPTFTRCRLPVAARSQSASLPASRSTLIRLRSLPRCCSLAASSYCSLLLSLFLSRHFAYLLKIESGGHTCVFIIYRHVVHFAHVRSTQWTSLMECGW